MRGEDTRMGKDGLWGDEGDRGELSNCSGLLSVVKKKYPAKSQICSGS